MIKLKTTLLALVTVAAAANTAVAQPSAPGDAPVNASEPARGRLSHVNGVPIPVGTHNEYYYSIKRFNISTNPIGWMLGSYGVSASYALNNHLAIRGDANYYDPVGDDDDISGFEFGVGAPVYFRRAYQGPFLEPGLIVRTFEENGNRIDSTTTFGPQVLAGWAWMWDSGLNISFALGAGRNFSSDENYNDVFANGYLRFGYAF